MQTKKYKLQTLRELSDAAERGSYDVEFKRYCDGIVIVRFKRKAASA